MNEAALRACDEKVDFLAKGEVVTGLGDMEAGAVGTACRPDGEVEDEDGVNAGVSHLRVFLMSAKD